MGLQMNIIGKSEHPSQLYFINGRGRLAVIGHTACLTDNRKLFYELYTYFYVHFYVTSVYYRTNTKY